MGSAQTGPLGTPRGRTGEDDHVARMRAAREEKAAKQAEEATKQAEEATKQAEEAKKQLEEKARQVQDAEERAARERICR